MRPTDRVRVGRALTKNKSAMFQSAVAPSANDRTTTTAASMQLIIALNSLVPSNNIRIKHADDWNKKINQLKSHLANGARPTPVTLQRSKRSLTRAFRNCVKQKIKAQYANSIDLMAKKLKALSEMDIDHVCICHLPFFFVKQTENKNDDSLTLRVGHLLFFFFF